MDHAHKSTPLNPVASSLHSNVVSDASNVSVGIPIPTEPQAAAPLSDDTPPEDKTDQSSSSLSPGVEKDLCSELIEGPVEILTATDATE